MTKEEKKEIIKRLRGGVLKKDKEKFCKDLEVLNSKWFIPFKLYGYPRKKFYVLKDLNDCKKVCCFFGKNSPKDVHDFLMSTNLISEEEFPLERIEEKYRKEEEIIKLIEEVYQENPQLNFSIHGDW